MKHANRTRAVRLTAALLLAASAGRAALAGDAVADNLRPADILKKSLAQYAALNNYSDDGKTVSFLGDTSVAPCNYTIKMARPSLYRIAWDQDSGFFDQKGAVWSAGAGNFLKMGNTVQKEADLSMALSSAAGISGGAAASIPGAFFNVVWGNPLGVPPLSEKRLSDARVDSVDCFVLARDLQGTTTTLWIGKTDFLIHQVQRVTSADAVKARLAEAAKRDPKLAASLPATAAQAITSTEIHTHIVVNQKLSPADFDH